MANPYTRNIRYNYKPLDLSTIGKAAVMNQQQFDQTQNALDEFDVNINALPQQAEWANKQTKEYRDRIDSLSEQLAQNRDPRQAVRELQKLNKEYRRRTGPGGDINIVQNNVAAMQDYRKRHQEAIKAGKNVPRNFEDYLGMQMRGFKGFDEQGNPESLSLRDMTVNQSKQLTDRAIELSKLSKADVIEQLGQYGSIGGFQREAIDTTWETLDNSQRVGYIQNILANSQEFKPWLDQEKELIQYRNQSFDGSAFVNNQLSSLDAQEKSIREQLNSTSLSDELENQLENQLSEIQNTRNQYQEGVDQYGATNYGRMIKSANDYNSITGVPSAIANLRNYQKRTFDRKTITNQAGLAKYKSGLRRGEAEHKASLNRKLEDYKNSYGLNQAKEGTIVKFAQQSEKEINNVISSLSAKVKSGEGTPQDKKDLFLAKFYKNKANQDITNSFINRNKNLMSQYNITKEELVSGKLDNEIKASITEEQNNRLQDALTAQQGKYKGAQPMDYKYSVNEDGNIEAILYNTKTNKPYYMKNPITGNREGTLTFESDDPNIKNKLELIGRYKKEKESHFEEGVALDASSFKPDTKRGQKEISANFISNLGYNDFRDSMTEEEFNELKQGRDFDVTPVIGFQSQDIKFKITYKDASNNIQSTVIEQPIYEGESDTQFSNVTGNWMQQLAAKDKSGKANRLVEDLRVMKQYNDFIPTFETSNGDVDEDMFKVSSESINQFIPNLHNSLKNKYAFSSTTSGSGYLIKKDGNTLKYYGVNPNTGNITEVSKNNYTQASPINKEQALQYLNYENNRAISSK